MFFVRVVIGRCGGVVCFTRASHSPISKKENELIGTVIFYAEDKGWGFIRPNDGGADIFAHARSLIGTSALIRGQRVEFDEAFDQQRGKYRADRVTVL
jgi:CspA family cold shock protein